MKKQNDKPDPLEDAVQKCKEEMTEIINKANCNLLGTIKMLEDRVLAQESKITAMGDRMTAQDEEIASLKKELGEARSRNMFEEGELQPSVIEELNTIKEQVRAIKEGEEQHKEMTTSWLDVITKTQQKAEEAEKWIEVAKKGESKETTSIPTVINLTLEEEQRRRVRSLHVRICGLKDKDNVDEEVKELMALMGVPEPMHSRAWRVGNKKNGSKGETSKERALILRSPSMEAKKDFLRKRPTLKKTCIFLGDDLTLSQLAHMREVMPKIQAARAKGKMAFYTEVFGIIRTRPLLTIMVLSMFLVFFVHPALGLIVLVLLHTCNCYMALCSQQQQNSFVRSSEQALDQSLDKQMVSTKLDNEQIASPKTLVSFKDSQLEIFNYSHGLLLLHLIATAMLIPSLVAWGQRLGMDKSLPWFLDASLSFGIVLHGFFGSKLDINIPLVPIPTAPKNDSGLSFVYALAGLYSYLAGLALAPYRVFYGLAVIGILTVILKILERRGRTKGDYSSKRRHFHRH
ncbi:hypothetical protein L7F22_026343 [Adiantum nelumboides]|nr:hypothetical protein [Adiantum nelumboides]